MATEMTSPGAHWNNRRAYAQFLTQTRETSDQQERAPPPPPPAAASCPRSTALALVLAIVVLAGLAAAFRMNQLNVFVDEAAPPPDEDAPAAEVHDPQSGPRVVDAPIPLRYLLETHESGEVPPLASF